AIGHRLDIHGHPYSHILPQLTTKIRPVTWLHTQAQNGPDAAQTLQFHTLRNKNFGLGVVTRRWYAADKYDGSEARRIKQVAAFYAAPPTIRSFCRRSGKTSPSIGANAASL